MKKLGWILSLMCLLWSCSDRKEEFVVEATINNLEGRPLYAVYELGEDFIIDTLRPDNGYISLRNSSAELIPIQFYYADKTPFTKIYVKNGDRIKISGDGKAPFGLELKGSDINKKLFKFNQTNKEVLQAWLTERNLSLSGLKSAKYPQAFQEVQEVVVDYVNQNPESQVSAILIGDYLLGEADYALCDSLISTLSEEVLQSPIATPILSYQQFQKELSADSVLPKFQWIAPTDTVAPLELQKSKATLLYFQSSSNFASARRNKTFLTEWSKKYSADTLQLIEISLDTDSATWRKLVQTDSVNWERRWVQEGYLSAGITDLNIRELPYFIVADSTGRIVTRGLPPDSLDSYIVPIIYPDSIYTPNR